MVLIYGGAQRICTDTSCAGVTLSQATYIASSSGRGCLEDSVFLQLGLHCHKRNTLPDLLAEIARGFRFLARCAPDLPGDPVFLRNASPDVPAEVAWGILFSPQNSMAEAAKAGHPGTLDALLPAAFPLAQSHHSQCVKAFGSQCPHRSQDERAREGWVSAPVDHHSLPRHFLVNKRFVVVQQNKPRVIDDCPASSVDSSVQSLSRRWPAWLWPSCRAGWEVYRPSRRRPAVPLHALSRSRATGVPSPSNVAHASSVAMSSLSSHGVTLRPAGP